MDTKIHPQIFQMVEKLKKEGLDAILRGGGHKSFEISHLKNVENAAENSLTFYIGDDCSKVLHLKKCVLVCKAEINECDESVVRIETSKPKLAFYILAQDFVSKPIDGVIHPTAEISAEASIHPSVSIGPYCHIGKCHIGEGTVLHSHVSIYDHTKIKDRVTVESNTCIGSTGQIWAWGLDGKRWMMPQIGGVVIESNCFIGSNVSIVRGALQNTIISRGCRIAHGSMVGHNCYIGEETFLSNRVAVPGSVTIGRYCFLGSGAVIRSGAIIGDKVTIGAGAVVVGDFKEPGIVLAGVPARIIKKIESEDNLKGIPPYPNL